MTSIPCQIKSNPIKRSSSYSSAKLIFYSPLPYLTLPCLTFTHIIFCFRTFAVDLYNRLMIENPEALVKLGKYCHTSIQLYDERRDTYWSTMGFFNASREKRRDLNESCSGLFLCTRDVFCPTPSYVHHVMCDILRYSPIRVDSDRGGRSE